ncbi:NADP-dependent oxidoreductase domain protein [Paramyrothecium foliicola]|nr:NADP-dependent oxidoreductase domain protein [Paramyrothecium foliicola]
MTPSAAPQLIFGCGGLGNEIVGNETVSQLLRTLKEGGVTRVDTSATYPPTDIGASQRLLGQHGAPQMGFAVDTKVLTSLTGKFDGTLEPEKITRSAMESAESLQFGDNQRIHVFYAHVPDMATPLEDQVAAFDALYKRQIFEKFGVCNLPTKLLSEFIDVSEHKNYVKPTVFQGRYNFIDRTHEGPTLDLVRQHGMQFVAHSPHASGFLSGALTTGEVEGTRFEEGNIMSGEARLYDQAKYHALIRSMDELLKPHGIPKTEAALRWLAFHSELKPEDAIIFGSSKIEQVEKNIAAIKKGPLPEGAVTGLGRIYESLK